MLYFHCTQQYNESFKNHSNPTHIFNDKSFIVLPEALQVRFVGMFTCKKVRKAQLCRISNNSLLHLRVEKKVSLEKEGQGRKSRNLDEWMDGW